MKIGLFPAPQKKRALAASRVEAMTDAAIPLVVVNGADALLDLRE
jgi:hypothetical protein